MKVFPEMVDMVSKERNKYSELEKLSYKQLKQKTNELGLSLNSIETKYKNKEATCKIKCTSKHNSHKRDEIISLIYKQMYNPIIKRKSKRKTKTTSQEPISPPESPSLRDPPQLPRRSKTRNSSLRAQKKKKRKSKKRRKLKKKTKHRKR